DPGQVRPRAAPAAGRVLALPRGHREEQALVGPGVQGDRQLPRVPPAARSDLGVPGVPQLPSAGGAMNAQVVCRIRAGVNLTFNGREKEAMVGRDPQAAVSVPVEGVSRQHAKITWDGKNYWLEDLKSTNGTFLNSQTVSRERLRHLDVITLGKEVDLVFVLREAEEAAAAAPAKKLGIVRAALVPESGAGGAGDIPRAEIPRGGSPDLTSDTRRS